MPDSNFPRGPHDARAVLSTIGDEVRKSFVENRTILSFEEYLDVFAQSPRRQARNAAQYVRDAIDHFGHEESDTPAGRMRRFKLFDRSFAGEVPLAGHEEVQNAVYRVLSNFVRLGRVNKLILLHGPNGSAKSSLITAIMRGMEFYSRQPEGALYRFNWIFPSQRLVKSSVGFGAGREGQRSLESYAHLEGESIDARLVCEMKDHPLFLIPRRQRRELLESSCRATGGSEANDVDDFILSDHLLEGELCQKCRLIYSALLSHYAGDYRQVLRHIQVERFYVSRRYQQAAVTVEPQMSVDAAFRQVTADRSIANLPSALQSLALFEPIGALVNANRGMIEYSDLLKRPLEAYKYLLGASETSQVPMADILLQLDQVLIASSNEKHLAAFKEHPDFASFKGRIELVRVPYLRRFSIEKQIYDHRVTPVSAGRHVAPHATRVAAMWAVLTRLKRPMIERYEGEVRDLIDDLSPLEKMYLYDSGRTPDRLTMQQAKELRSRLPELYSESDTYPNYEGRIGASAREIITALFNAAQSPSARCLTPALVLEELEAICRDRSVYDYLQQQVIDGYHDHEEFVRVVEAEYLDLIDEEIRDSMGLVSETQYRELFSRYVTHVSHWVKGERIRNRITGEYEPASEAVMVEMESIITPHEDDRANFRRGLIANVGAFRLDHPDEAVDFPRIFPDLFRRLRDHYYEERKKVLRRNKQNILKYLSDDRKELSKKEIAHVEGTLETMVSRYGYCEHCARDAILHLMKKRYAD